MVVFSFLTIFPNVIEEYTNTSIWKKAKNKGIITVNIINIRNFTEDRHKTVDDRPFGGGPGMVMMFTPVYRALVYAKQKYRGYTTRVFLLTPKGKVLTQEFVQAFMHEFYDNMHFIFVIPHYEGIDTRITRFVDYKVSIGPYILSGGELPALVTADAFLRLIPGVLGNPESVVDETVFSVESNRVLIEEEAPVYTRPRRIMVGGVELEVPAVLVSGDHKAVKQYKDAFRTKNELEFLTVEDVRK